MTNKETRRAAARSKSKKIHGNVKAKAVQVEATDTWTTGAGCSGSISKVSPQTQSEELQEKTTFIVLPKEHKIDEFE